MSSLAATAADEVETEKRPGTTALLFRKDATEELHDWEDGLPRLGRTSILWIDLERPEEADVDRLAEVLELADDTRRDLLGEGAARILDHGSYLLVAAVAPIDAERRDLQRIVCLVGKHWIVTAHDTPLEILDTFRKRAMGSGATGMIDGPVFLANLLEWVLQSYFEALEEIERSLEEIDMDVMRGRVSSEEPVLERLAGYRHEIGTLRRALTSHREATVALAKPELEAIGGGESAQRFSDLQERLEQTIQAARDSREAVVGSFDLLIASTGQRTNDIMKLLTLASVLLLPGTLIAGVLGMNFDVSFFDDPGNFWIAVALIGAVAAATLAVARLRSWI